MSDSGPNPGPRWRGVGSSVLLILAAIGLPLAVTAGWARTTIGDPAGFSRTVAPLARDARVTAALENRVTDAVMDRVESLNLDTMVIDWLIGTGVPPRLAELSTVIAEGANARLRASVSDAAHAIVTAPGFGATWDTVHQRAHQQLLAILQGDSRLIDAGGGLSLQLENVAGMVRQELLDRGHRWAARIPPATAEWPLVGAATLDRAQGFYRVLTSTATALLIGVPLLFAAAIALSRNRWRTIRWAGLATAGGMVLLGVGLLIGESALASGNSSGMANPVAEAVVETLTAGLHRWIQLTAVIAAAVVIAGFLIERIRNRRPAPADALPAHGSPAAP